MKKFLSLFLILSIFLTGCTPKSSAIDSKSNDEKDMVVTLNPITTEVTSDNNDANIVDSQLVSLNDIDYLDVEVEDLSFSSLSDPDLLPYMEGAIYHQLIDEVGSDVFIENISTVYISQEYIEELSYNSRSNIFFGYTLQELDAQFQGTKYIFTVENNQTVVKPMEDYDDTYDKIIKNVAIGTGVILVCVTVSVLSGLAGATAASMIFAVSAETGTAMGLSSGLISGVAAGITTGITTGDWDQALVDGELAASEGFMFGAIGGAILGGAGEAIGLHGATLNGLTMNEAATIQKESKIPLKLIKEFQSFEQYEIIRDSGMYGGVISGNPALIRDIDIDFIDENGLTNLQRMQKGLAPIDPASGLAYELHHLGQTQDATLAILTQAEHRGAGNHAIWHDLISESVVDHGAAWDTQRANFWKSFAKLVV